MRRSLLAFPLALLATLAVATPALACGGLIGRNGAVNLVRTTTFAAYHDGVEHYVTAFSYAGAGGEFGAIVPLPGIPSDVRRGGDWTLQRLIRETTPVAKGLFQPLGQSAAADRVQVLLEKRIDALDVTVLKGGGADVGVWAKDHGFLLPPDAPEVLDFYAKRSPIFLTAVFDGAAAAKRGQLIGDGTPVHIVIPTDNPWVPLRILGLGKAPAERVEADLFLLTDRRPAMLPAPSFGGALRSEHSAPAPLTLLNDLRSDKGMDWIPAAGWLTKIRVDAAASDLTHDLAIDASGANAPSRVAAGYEPIRPPADPWDRAIPLAIALLAAAYVAAGVALARARRGLELAH